MDALGHERAWKRGGSETPWIIGHRGDSFHAPENTLEAGRRAWEAGADAWELDVQLTRDGVPVVMHDASLLRTTDAARVFAGDQRVGAGFLVADFDLEEVRGLDAGSWFLDPKGGPRSAAGFGTRERLAEADRAHFASGRVRVPTLAEVLELTRGLDWLVNVELKAQPGDTPALVEAVLAEIETAGVAGRVLISSFDHEAVAQVVRAGRGIATGVLADRPLVRAVDYVRDWVGADAYHPSAATLGADSRAYRRSPALEALDRETLGQAQRASVPIYVYTVNDLAAGGLADHLANAGAAGLFTDNPAALAARWGHPRRVPRS